MVDALDAYLARSLAIERSLVAYEQELAAVTTGTRPDLGSDDPEARAATEHLADHARAELQRCLQARCRRMRDRSLTGIVLALCEAGLCDHAAVLVTADWESDSSRLLGTRDRVAAKSVPGVSRYSWRLRHPLPHGSLRADHLAAKMHTRSPNLGEVTQEDPMYMRIVRGQAPPGQIDEAARRWQAFWGVQMPQIPGFRHAHFAAGPETDRTVSISVWEQRPDAAVMEPLMEQFRELMADISAGPPTFEEYETLADI